MSSNLLPFTCKDCPNRYPGCHGKCEKYLAEKAFYRKRKEDIRTRNAAVGYTVDEIRKKRDRAAKRRRGASGVRKTYF